MTSKFTRLLCIATTVAVVFSGCADEQPSATHAIDHAVDYASNHQGLITPETLERWLNDWESVRPAHVQGDLVVLQYGFSEDALGTAASTEGVRVYDASDDFSVLIEPRNNGLLAAGRAPARGVRVDAFLRKYTIDPQADFVVFVSGDLTHDSLSWLSMAWLTFRYWGIPDDRLAIVNGDINDLSEDVRADEPLEALYEGKVRVLALPSTNFSITLDLEDVRTWVQERPHDAQLWDTRIGAEYESTAISESARETSCIVGAPRCSAHYAGRIAGAKHLAFTGFLDEKHRVRPPQELLALLHNHGISRGTTQFLYDGDGARSAIVAFILLAITDHDARWYPNSFVEWSALNATHPETKLRRLSEENPWRTDTPEFTEELGSWSSLQQGVQPIVINSRTESAAAVHHEDEQYLADPPALPVVNFNDPSCF